MHQTCLDVPLQTRCWLLWWGQSESFLLMTHIGSYVCRCHCTEQCTTMLNLSERFFCSQTGVWFAFLFNPLSSSLSTWSPPFLLTALSCHYITNWGNGYLKPLCYRLIDFSCFVAPQLFQFSERWAAEEEPTPADCRDKVWGVLLELSNLHHLTFPNNHSPNKLIKLIIPW